MIGTILAILHTNNDYLHVQPAVLMTKVMEARILDSWVELTLRKVLGIAKKDFDDTIIDLVKTKRLSTEQESAKPMNMNMVTMDEVAAEEDYRDSHYTQPPGQEQQPRRRYWSVTLWNHWCH